MKTDEFLTLQALKFKQSHSGGIRFDGTDLFQHVIDSDPEVKAKLRNICAFIQPGLFDQIEEICTMLDLSKREFVEMALIDLVAKAHSTIEKFDVLPEGE